MTTIDTETVDMLGRRLRALQSVIEFLDEHGEDLPEQPMVTAYGHSFKVDVDWYLTGTEDQKALAARIVRLIGGKWAKSDANDRLYFRQRVVDVEFCVAVDREAVCERIVKGTHEVTIPAVAAQPERVQVVEDVEWVCGSVLAEATSGGAA
ncbi:MAG: hypothetical protein ACXVXP_08375 [Mycobacteriaceae bacterium]